jgi:hypothetical protein
MNSGASFALRNVLINLRDRYVGPVVNCYKKRIKEKRPVSDMSC